MIYINVPDMNDSVSQVTLEGKEYDLRFQYNGSYDYWSVGISDDSGAIVSLTKIVPNYPLFTWNLDARLPAGMFVGQTNKNRIGHYDFRDGDAEFVFIPYSEIDTDMMEE